MMKKDIEKKLDEMEKKVNEMKDVVSKMATKKHELEQPRTFVQHLKHLLG